jgi:hypothetical protein
MNMDANRNKKNSEAEKCLHVLKRLDIHLSALRSLNLNGAESGLLLETLSHIGLIKANLDKIIAGIETDPEAVRENTAKQARTSVVIKP